MNKPMLIAAAFLLSTGVAFAATETDPLVIDPISGETVLLSTIDTSVLTEDELAALAAQLEALESDGLDRVQDRTRTSEDEGNGEMHRYRYETATRAMKMTQAQFDFGGATGGSGGAGGSSGSSSSAGGRH